MLGSKLPKTSTIQSKHERAIRMVREHRSIMVSQMKTLKEKNEKFVKDFLDLLLEEPDPVKVVVIRPDEDKLDDFIDHA